MLGDEAVQALACARKKIERFASAWAECFDSGALGTGCPVDRTWRRVDALMGVMLEELGELIDVPPLDDGVI